MSTVQVTFHQLDHSPAVEAAIVKRVEKLDHFHTRITSCRVVVHTPHRTHRKGKLYAVSVDLTLPGGELAIGRSAAERHAHEDIYVAVRDAFDALERQLQEFVKRHRGETKAHEPRPRPAEQSE